MPENSNIIFNNNYSESEMSSKTYSVDFLKNRIVGEKDGIEALKDTIFKIINTERYKYDIYDWNYGVEFSDIIGMDRKLAVTEIENRIKDALSIDERIKNISDFQFVENKNSIEVSFTVESIFGNIRESKEVSICCMKLMKNLWKKNLI